MRDFIFAPFVALSLIALLILAICGGGPERRAAVLLVGVVLLTPLIDTYTIGNFRWAVALSSLVVFTVLLWMALMRDRWWLVFAAGCQLMALSTHLIVLLRLDALEWTMVSIRWLSWVFMMGIALFGAWEGRALSRIGRRPA